MYCSILELHALCALVLIVQVMLDVLISFLLLRENQCFQTMAVIYISIKVFDDKSILDTSILFQCAISFAKWTLMN